MVNLDKAVFVFTTKLASATKSAHTGAGATPRQLATSWHGRGLGAHKAGGCHQCVVRVRERSAAEAGSARTLLMYGWTGHKSSSGFSDIARPTLGVFASLDRLWALQLMR